MSVASAASSVIVRYIDITDFVSVSSRRELANRYLRRIAHETPAPHQMLSQNKPEALLRLPQLSIWLARVEQRIQDSVAPHETREAEPGRWLSEAVADVGLHFFRSSADLLPNEPFIYASKEGELVAEFEAPRGRLTSIISPTVIILFASVDGRIIEERLGPNAGHAVEPLRDELKKINQIFAAGPDGAVAAAG